MSSCRRSSWRGRSSLPPLLGALCGIVVAVTGALYFADTRMKQPDNSFRGFPVVWNMAVFVLYAFLPPPAVTVAIVIALAVLTFLPVNFVHPVRVVRWRAPTLAVARRLAGLRRLAALRPTSRRRCW